MTLNDPTTDTVIITPPSTTAQPEVASTYDGHARFGPGMIVLALGWLLIAAAMVFIGGAVGLGILQGVAGG